MVPASIRKGLEFQAFFHRRRGGDNEEMTDGRLSDVFQSATVVINFDANGVV